MADKKIKLKQMIYESLNDGYVTPIKNEEITTMYMSYKQLGGNGEVKTLYEDRYIKLNVHEDRRKTK